MSAHSAYYVRPELAYQRWWPQYGKALYIIAQTADANQKPQEAKATQVFFYSLFQLLPDNKSRQYMQDLLAVKPYIVDTLEKLVPNMFHVYPQIKYLMRTQPTQFTQMCFENKDGEALFIWVYFMHVLLNHLHSYSVVKSATTSVPQYNQQKLLYPKDKITKADWGNSIWFILHTTSLYAPEPMEASFKNYRNMLLALQYILPCPKCREHLKQNLYFVDFEKCPRTNTDLFKCSWQLHNIVNQSDNKPTLNFQQAYMLYM